MKTKLAPYFYQVHESSERNGEFDTFWDTFETMKEAQDFINEYKKSDEDKSGYKIEKVKGIPPREYFIGDLKWFIKDYPCAKYPANNETNILPDGTIFANFTCGDGAGIYREEQEEESILSISGTIGIIPLEHLEFNKNEIQNLLNQGVCLIWEFEKCLEITYGLEAKNDIGIGSFRIQTNLKNKPSEFFSSFENILKYWIKDSQLKNYSLPEKKETELKGAKYFYYENSKGDKSKPIKVDEYGIFVDIDGKKYDCQSNTSKKDDDLLTSNITQSLFGENIIHKTYYSPGFREIGPFNNPPKEWISYEINFDKISSNNNNRESSIINQIIDYGVENISFFLFKDQDKRLHVSGKFLKLFLKFRLELDMKYELKKSDNLCNEFFNIYLKYQDEIYKKINNKLIKEKCNLSYEIPLSIDLSFSESTGWILVEDDWVFSK